MSTPFEQTGRNRRNVMTGAPDVRFSGGFFIGPAATDSTLFPTGAGEDIQEIITRLNLSSGGFITTDGVSESEERTTEKIRDWNLDVIDILETDYGLTLTTTFAEAANATVLRYLYGEDNVDVTAEGVHIRKGARILDNHSVLFDLKGKNNATGRGFAAETQVSSIAEIAYNKAGLIQYNVTIDVLNDVTGTYLHTWFGNGDPVEPGDPEA